MMIRIPKMQIKQIAMEVDRYEEADEGIVGGWDYEMNFAVPSEIRCNGCERGYGPESASGNLIFRKELEQYPDGSTSKKLAELGMKPNELLAYINRFSVPTRYHGAENLNATHEFIPAIANRLLERMTMDAKMAGAVVMASYIPVDFEFEFLKRNGFQEFNANERRERPAVYKFIRGEVK